jgi:hypothetical protein
LRRCVTLVRSAIFIGESAPSASQPSAGLRHQPSKHSCNTQKPNCLLNYHETPHTLARCVTLFLPLPQIRSARQKSHRPLVLWRAWPPRAKRAWPRERSQPAYCFQTILSI